MSQGAADQGAPAQRAWWCMGRFRYVHRALARRLARLGYGAITGPIVLSMAARVLGLYTPGVRSVMAVVGPALMMFVGPTLLVVAWWLTRARPRAGSLSLEGDALSLKHHESSRRVALDALVDGVHLPSARDGFELRLRGGDAVVGEGVTWVSTPGASGAGDLIARLALDTGRRAAAMRTSPSVTPAIHAAWAFFALVIGSTIVIGHRMPHALTLPWIAALALTSWVGVAWSQGPEVTVGVDGLQLRNLGRTRFLAWSDVASVSLEAGQLVAVAVDGERVSLGSAAGASAGRADALYRRIGGALAAARAASSAGDAGVTARGGRTVAAWRGAMGALVHGAGYREGTVREEDLVAVLGGPRASADQRVGAAIALVASDRGANAGRVRVAAGALADERVRVLIERVADGRDDDEALAAATEAPSARRG